MPVHAGTRWGVAVSHQEQFDAPLRGRWAMLAFWSTVVGILVSIAIWWLPAEPLLLLDYLSRKGDIDGS